MDITNYASQSRLPLNLLTWLVREKIVSNPLTEKDLIGLEMQEKLWGKAPYVKKQLKKFNKENRYNMCVTCDFDTKWETFAFKRYSNMEPGERISMKKLISEIELLFDLSITNFQKRKLYSIRESVYNRRRYVKKLRESGQ